MKNHFITILMLAVAAIVFVLRFFVKEDLKVYCDIAAFALPTIAAIFEIIVSVRTEKQTAKQIQKLKDDQLSVRVEDGTLIFDKGVKELFLFADFENLG